VFYPCVGSHRHINACRFYSCVIRNITKLKSAEKLGASKTQHNVTSHIRNYQVTTESRFYGLLLTHIQKEFWLFMLWFHNAGMLNGLNKLAWLKTVSAATVFLIFHTSNMNKLSNRNTRQPAKVYIITRCKR